MRLPLAAEKRARTEKTRPISCLHESISYSHVDISNSFYSRGEISTHTWSDMARLITDLNINYKSLEHKNLILLTL